MMRAVRRATVEVPRASRPCPSMARMAMAQWNATVADPRYKGIGRFFCHGALGVRSSYSDCGSLYGLSEGLDWRGRTRCKR